MRHKHCIFCGEAIPVPRPTTFSPVCDSPQNTTPADTSGKRYHAVIVGSSKNDPQASGRSQCTCPTVVDLTGFQFLDFQDDCPKHGKVLEQFEILLNKWYDAQKLYDISRIARDAHKAEKLRAELLQLASKLAGTSG